MSTKKAKDTGWGKKLAREWRNYQPPSRPSISEVAIYEKYMKKLPKGSSVLIFGSTPEIRDLAAKYQVRTVICDWSGDIPKALKLLMKYKQAKEDIYVSDWRKMKLEEKFDMIIGDCALTVLPCKDVSKAFEKIAQYLKDGGVVVQRIWVRYKGEDYSTEDIVQIYRKKPKKIHWYTQMLFPVFLHYYDRGKESLSGEGLYKKLEQDYKKGKVPKILVQLFSLVRNHKTKNNVLVKTDLEKTTRKHFRISKIEYGKDAFRRNAPIYILKKR